MNVGMERLSIVIITHNEERNIRACLDSVRWADEIVVVDSFSIDATMRICHEYTQKVYQRPWPGYGLQKNFGIEKSTGAWILIVDADERVTPELREEIQSVLKKKPEGNIVAYEIPRKNHFLGQWVRQAGQHPDYQLRLFKKGKAWYNEKKLHENLIIQGSVARLKSCLTHYSCESLSDWLRKLTRYSRLMAEEQSISRNSINGFDLLFRPSSTFIKIYGLKKGYSEGIRGMIISVYASLFTFLKYARMWEKLGK
jgi:glycosyltransferase involved in cell wall biosynthesis